jgi:hypothetical protein
MVKTATICGAVCLLAATWACAVSTPLTPAPAASNSPAKAADGSTLKANAPTLVSPVNNDRIPNERPTFVIDSADGQFAKVAFFYEFELTNDVGELVRTDVTDTTQFQLPVALAFDAPYRWRSRAVLDNAVGPWSGQARFFTAQPPQLNRPTRTSSYDEWKVWFEQVRQLRNIGPTVSVGGLAATRADLLAVEADWQNGWRGDLRARLFLPVPGCGATAANNPNPPTCAYSRTVDVGNIGQTWQWVVRGQS